MKKILLIIWAVATAAALDALPAQRLQRIDAYLAEYARSVPVPGFSAVVSDATGILFAKGYGVERLGSSKPMTERSPSAVGSLTKSFTALAIMQLVEQGTVSLEDPVVKYLPWFRTMDEAESVKITLGMLLSNSSGLPSDQPGAWISTLEDDPGALERGVRALASVSLQRRGSAAFEYSNMGFNGAGVIIEKVSGLQYAEYLRRYVLAPLGMSRSTTSFAQFARLGVLFGHQAGIDRAIPAEPSFIPGMLAAGSELRCSAEDLGRYLAMLLNGGSWQGRRIVSAQSVRRMWTPTSSFEYASSLLKPDERTWSYGLGWFISRVEGRTLVHHGGNRITMSSYTVIDPERKLAASILLNIDSLDRYRFVQPPTVVNNLLHLAAGEPVTDFMVEKGPDPSANVYELPAGLDGRYVGEYLSQSGDGRLEISRSGNAFVAAFHSAGRSMECLVDFASPLTAYLRGIGGALPIAFRSSPEGRITGMEMSGFGGLLKQPPDAFADFRRVIVPGNASGPRVSVPMRTGWTTTERGGALEATSPDGDVGIAARLVAANAAAGVGTGEAADRFETFAGLVWRERAATSGTAAAPRQTVVVDTVIGSMRLVVSLVAPKDSVTAAVRDALLPLMNGTREE